jgi:hypothetical protein
MEPEEPMKEGLDYFYKSIACFKRAIVAYKKRNDETKGDDCNIANVNNALINMALASADMAEIYDDILKV